MLNSDFPGNFGNASPPNLWVLNLISNYALRSFAYFLRHWNFHPQVNRIPGRL